MYFYCYVYIYLLFVYVSHHALSFFPIYGTVALPDDGCNYLPKHVAVNVMNNKYRIICSVVLIEKAIN